MQRKLFSFYSSLVSLSLYRSHYFLSFYTSVCSIRRDKIIAAMVTAVSHILVLLTWDCYLS